MDCQKVFFTARKCFLPAKNIYVSFSDYLVVLPVEDGNKVVSRIAMNHQIFIIKQVKLYG